MLRGVFTGKVVCSAGLHTPATLRFAEQAGAVLQRARCAWHGELACLVGHVLGRHFCTQLHLPAVCLLLHLICQTPLPCGPASYSGGVA